MSFGDVVVLLPGISGSALAKDGREVWGTSTGAIMRALTSGADSIRDLTLPAEDDYNLDDLGDGVVATQVIPDLHLIPGLWKIDGYSRIAGDLIGRLGLEPGSNYFELAYDWRRDNRVAARALARRSANWLKNWRETSGNADAKLILVAHSMGGLIARHFLEVLEGWRDTRILVSFGTPYAGSLNALRYIGQGYNEGFGPVRFDLSEVLRSFTSIYQLLPTYKCLLVGNTLLRLDEAVGVPHLDRTRLIGAKAFHADIAAGQAANRRAPNYGYRIAPVVGIEQPTAQSARLIGASLQMLRTHPESNHGGDGTVPRVSATPDELRGMMHEMYVAEAHGSLQNASAVLDHLFGVLTAQQIDFERLRHGSRISLSLYLKDLYEAGRAGEVAVFPARAVRTLRATVVDVQTTMQVAAFTLRPSDDGFHRGAFSLPEGAYRLTVKGDENVTAITDVFLVASNTPRAVWPSGQDIQAIPVLPKSIQRSPAFRGLPPGQTPTLSALTKFVTPFLPPLGAVFTRLSRFNVVPPPPPPPSAAMDSEESALRYPSIKFFGEIIPGREVTIFVDLLHDRADPATTADPIRFAGLPDSWTSFAVEVELQSDGIEFEEDSKEIEVVRGKPSRHVSFVGRAKVDLRPGTRTEVIAIFHHNNRFAGHARHNLTVSGSNLTVSGSNGINKQLATAKGDVATNAITIDRMALSPDLTVKIFRLEGTPEGHLFWTLSVKDPPERLIGKLNGTVFLGKSTEDYARALIANCPTLKAPLHLDELKGIGEQIWSVAPQCFRSAYWVLQEERPNFSIQFVTDDPHVPWELMRPTTPEGMAAPILAVGHPVARWLALYEGTMRNRLPTGRIASIAPSYSDPNDFLNWAQAEAAHLRQAGALPINGTVAAVLTFFKTGVPNEKVGLIHFAGHGKFGALNQSELLLEDGVLKPLQLNTAEVTLGRTQRPFVMLNACEVGSLTQVLGSIGGWAAVLSRGQFSGVLAPLWAVYDQEASEIGEEFRVAVWSKNERAGEALRKIREKRQENSATPFAYVLYGDVMAVVQARVNS